MNQLKLEKKFITYTSKGGGDELSIVARHSLQVSGILLLLMISYEELENLSTCHMRIISGTNWQSTNIRRNRTNTILTIIVGTNCTSTDSHI